MLRTYAIELKWGLIFFAITLLWMILEKIGGLHSSNIGYHQILTIFFTIPAILIYILALREKRQSTTSGFTWEEGLKSGAIVTLIVAALSPLGQLITHLYLSPEYFENVIDYTVENGKMTEEEAKNYFNLKSYIWQSAVGAVLMGLLTSAIVAIFTKRNPV